MADPAVVGSADTTLEETDDGKIACPGDPGPPCFLPAGKSVDMEVGALVAPRPPWGKSPAKRRVTRVLLRRRPLTWITWTEAVTAEGTILTSWEVTMGIKAKTSRDNLSV